MKIERLTPEGLRTWRDRFSLKRTDLASMLGRSPRTVEKWEQGAPIPRWLDVLCSVLGQTDLGREVIEKAKRGD